MELWQKQLRYNPVSSLLSTGNEALQYFVQRDLLGEPAGPVSRLWQLPEARKILKSQQPDGSWIRSAGKEKHPAVNYRLIETWKQFRFLVDVFGFSKDHPQAEKAAEFLFSCQTNEGDIRGFLANQYATYYTGAILSLLIQAGYSEDPRIEKGIQWLLSMRQDDRGWTIPILTHSFGKEEIYRLTSRNAPPVEPDRTKPFSHNWTGMVIRAFAVHKEYRKSAAAKTAANLLVSRFFQPDSYTSYRAASYWVRFQYPFWWNNLVAALDSVSRIGLSVNDPQIAKGLRWLIGHQEKDGLWRETCVKPLPKGKVPAKEMERRGWVSLAICRVFRRYYG